MSSAPSRLKLANAPPGGSRYTSVTCVGAHNLSSAPSRLKLANAPPGGSRYRFVTGEPA